jgi:molybdenum cofactor biosynthesis enzyme MoaA
MLMRIRKDRTNSRERDWTTTASGKPRGYIQPHALDELWFHTGTACNLKCPFCLEGSTPGDTRLDHISLADARPFMDEARSLGVRQFSFTGGEPFIVKDFVNILNYAATLRPCLVLTNGTDPVLKRLRQIERLADSPQPISFRISIDYPDAARHDEGRGSGNFDKALTGMRSLHDMGFPVSLARQQKAGEDAAAVEKEFRQLLGNYGLPEDIRIVAFPDFDVPYAHPKVPEVTEDCMTRYQTEQTRRSFMCAFSKMVIKRNGEMRVYACTLVDDDPAYDLGASLGETQGQRIHMRHHRCHTCFAFGSSCSEL